MKGRKYNALIRRLVRKPGIKTPLGQKPGNVLLHRMQRIELRGLEL